MSVLVGSARINEYGQAYGGQPGDQTMKECAIENWYLHNLGWTVIRAKDPTHRAKIAQDMRYICDNDNIGYDFGALTDLYEASKPYEFNASKVTKKVNTNCAKSVRVCVLYAGIQCEDFYTGDEVQKLEKTGKFDILTEDKYCRSSDYLVEGDILCTRTQGHTVVVLTNGDKVGSIPCKVTGDVWMRIGPSISYDKIIIPPKEFIPKNAIVHVLSVVNGWARCIYEGKEGYCSLKYLSTMYKVVDNDVWMRKNPGILSAGIEVIKKGTLLLSAGRSASVLGRPWYEVTHDGKTGWCSSKYLEKCI